MNIQNTAIANLLQEHHINLPFVRTIGKGGRVDVALLSTQALTHPMLIADKASYAAAEHALSPTLPSHKKYILNAPAKPTLDENVKRLMALVAESKPDALIVVGSGSLSDMGKYVARQHSLPLIIIATAPSMNGYTSANASLIINGLKQSVSAKMADEIVVPEEVIAAAPSQMVQAGKADALASISAELDWYLSHMLLGTAYFPEIFTNQKPLLADLDDPMKLMECLLLQGLGMTAAGSSAPASGGEHILAHLVELLHPDLCASLLHGELIGITHPVYFDYQCRLFTSPTPPKLRKNAPDELKKICGNRWVALENACRKKQHLLDENRELTQKQLEKCWPQMKDTFNQIISQYKFLVSQSTNAHNNPLKQYVEEIIPISHMSRDRLTCLDLEIQ